LPDPKGCACKPPGRCGSWLLWSSSSAFFRHARPDRFLDSAGEAASAPRRRIRHPRRRVRAQAPRETVRQAGGERLLLLTSEVATASLGVRTLP
jgi:hypothetical protein